MSDDDVDGGILLAEAMRAARAQGKVAHLAFDAAGHHAAAAGTDGDRAHFVKDVSSGGGAWRGERPRHAAGCGGRRGAYA